MDPEEEERMHTRFSKLTIKNEFTWFSKYNYNAIDNYINPNNTVYDNNKNEEILLNINK